MGKENIVRSIETIVIMIVVVMMCIFVYKAGIHNGKTEMCTEMDKYYTKTGQCISCEESGRLWIDGECQIPKTQPMVLKKW